MLSDGAGPLRDCPYLPAETSNLEYRVMTEVSPEELEALLVRGWRRQGPFYFRPACGGCSECVSLRVPVDRFRPTATQRRIRRRAAAVRAALQRPVVDAERLDLYRRWHAAREEARGWEAAPLDARDYWLQFAYPHPATWELALRDGDGALVALTLCDITPRAWSAIFCFHDPARAALSPGAASVLLAIELARERGIPHLYLGYRVAGCPSMRYKALYRPHELLVGRPGPDEEPQWVEAP